MLLREKQRTHAETTTPVTELQLVEAHSAVSESSLGCPKVQSLQTNGFLAR